LMIVILIGTIAGVAYCLWLYTRIFHGTRRIVLLENDIKQENKIFWDLDKTEILFFGLLLLIIVSFSLNPQPIFDMLLPPTNFLISLYN
jgi:NADH:ubiquinone oxidoreductase subunit 4 (subunit M)